MRVVDLTGQSFGHLRVLEQAGRLRGGVRWKCLCDPDLGGCGNVTFVCSGDLRRERPVKSCGCDRGGAGKFKATHGHTRKPFRAKGGTPTYVSWLAMIQRCTNEKNASWRYYGGRGIKVCEPWLESFEEFLAHVGPRPSLAHSLDRFPDRNGNYAPGNVRWATHKEQAENRSTTKLDRWDVSFIQHWRSVGFSVKEISEAFGISRRHASRVSLGRAQA